MRSVQMLLPFAVIVLHWVILPFVVWVRFVIPLMIRFVSVVSLFRPLLALLLMVALIFVDALPLMYLLVELFDLLPDSVFYTFRAFRSICCCIRFECVDYVRAR